MHIHLYPTLNITISSIEITKKTAASFIADGHEVPSSNITPHRITGGMLAHELQVGILAHESMAHESMLAPELQVEV